MDETKADVLRQARDPDTGKMPCGHEDCFNPTLYEACKTCPAFEVMVKERPPDTTPYFEGIDPVTGMEWWRVWAEQKRWDDNARWEEERRNQREGRGMPPLGIGG